MLRIINGIRKIPRNGKGSIEPAPLRKVAITIINQRPQGPARRDQLKVH